MTGPDDPGRGELLFLVGYRGAGKTTVAALLADRLGWGWIDADAALEAGAGRSIQQVFAEEGEAGFRRREARVLEELCRLRRYVIATGGGVVLGPHNRRRMQEAGRVVWLTADPETLAGRLESDPGSGSRRPALTVGGLEEVRELLRAREPLYRACADWAVDTAGRTPQEVAGAILGLLER